MEKHEHLKIAYGTALLFVTVISIFSFLTKLITSMIFSEDLYSALSLFLKDIPFWLIVTAITIFLLITYLKKFNLKNLQALISNETIRLTAGLLITLEGIINLSNLIPLYYVSIKSYNQTKQLTNSTAIEIFRRPLISNGITIFFILCQVLTGIYLLKFYKNKIEN